MRPGDDIEHRTETERSIAYSQVMSLLHAEYGMYYYLSTRRTLGTRTIDIAGGPSRVDNHDQADKI